MQSARYAAFASAGFAKNLRQAIFKRFKLSLLKISISSQLVVCDTYDDRCYQRAELLSDDYPCLCALHLNLIFAIAASFLINAEMAWIFVGVTIFLGVVLAIITKIVYPLLLKYLRAYDNLNNSIMENITNMRGGETYVKEQEETDKFKKASRRIYKMFMRAIRVVIMSNPAMMLFYVCILPYDFLVLCPSHRWW